ncbi:AMP-binding protein [Balneolales bacterium ANBcel1]|nr:AMP-binding protein [Balneolales bacterium ANBcel1]
MQTLVRFVEALVEEHADRPYMWEKPRIRATDTGQDSDSKTDDTYRPTTYRETLEQVYDFGAGLMSLGIEPGERVALLSEGRNDWVVSELAILFNGAVNVPLSVKLSPVELQFRLFHSDATVLIVSENQAQKITSIRENLPQLQRIILLDSKEQYAEDEISKNQVVQMGRKFLKKNREAFLKRKDAVQPDDPANISYTSGTTADPKGIILTHRNYTANVEQALTLMDIPPTYRTLLILPLDHSFAHTAGIYSFMAKGASIGMVQAGKTAMETLRNIPKNIREFKPNLLLSVPALAKSFRKNIEAAIRTKGPLIQRLFDDALRTAYRYNREGYNKNKRDLLSRSKLFLYDKILFSKIRENFGGELRFFIGGGALLDIELQRFFYALGMPMMQGYGLSEATPIISSNSLDRHKLGSSGHLVRPLELRIIDDEGRELPPGEKGEIIVKGENVMKGYWKNPQATRETIRNGWLHTGDMGYMDEDGFLYVLGRFKSLLIGHDGEKYSPESIEETLTEKSPCIEQIMLHNNQDPYTIALLYPSPEALRRAVDKEKAASAAKAGKAAKKEKPGEYGGTPGKEQAAGPGRSSDDELAADVDLALDIIEREIGRFRDGGEFGDHFPDRWLPTAVGILPEGFTEANKMMNSTMKIVRGKINDHYEELIQYLYLPEAKKIRNSRNRKVMEELLKRQGSQKG